MHKNWMRSVLSEWPWSKDKRLCRSVVPLQPLIPVLLALPMPALVFWTAPLCLLLRSHRVMLTFGLQELLASEEKNMVHKPELDRERNSVMHLSAAKADCEGIMTSFTFYSLLLMTIQIQRSSSDHSVAWLEHHLFLPARSTSFWPSSTLPLLLGSFWTVVTTASISGIRSSQEKL